MIQCTRCHRDTPLEDFAYRDSRTRRLSFCKLCDAARTRNYDRTHREEKQKYAQSHPRREKPCGRAGSVDLYNALLDIQNGCCGICQRTDPGRKGIRFFPMDHDHQTGKIRGLLCNVCNLRLGLVNEDPSRWEDARQYLEHPPAGGLEQLVAHRTGNAALPTQSGHVSSNLTPSANLPYNRTNFVQTIVQKVPKHMRSEVDLAA